MPDHFGEQLAPIRALQARRDRWDASYLVVQQDAMETAAPIVARRRGT